jgi:hypothetical protein
MIWSRLKNLKCPNCNKSLEKISGLLGGYSCSSQKCSFTISDIRFDEVVNNLYKRPPTRVHIPTDLENSEDLNNLGLEEESEGFDNDEEVYI